MSCQHPKTNYCLLAIIIFSVLIRFLAILKYGDFWGDEMFSFVYSQKPWLDSLKFWVWETNPPLHMFFLKLWFYIVPVNEFWARSLSLIFGASGIGALYFLTLRLFNKRTALMAALFLTLSPTHIFYSATARGYSLLILLTILAVDSFFRLFVEKNIHDTTLHSADSITCHPELVSGSFLQSKLVNGEILKQGQDDKVKKTTINSIVNKPEYDSRSATSVFLFITTHTLLLYTHITALSVFFVEMIVVVATQRRNFIRWFKLCLLPVFLWLIWAIPSLMLKMNIDTIGSAWFMNFRIEAGVLLNALQLLLAGPNYWYFGLLTIVGFLILTTLTFNKEKNAKTTNSNILFLAFFAILPVASAIMIGMWHIKFIIVALPWVLLLLSYSLNRRNVLLVAVALMFLIQGIFNMFAVLPLSKWSTLNDFIAKEFRADNKQILIYNYFTDKQQLDRYYHESMPLLAYFPYPKDTDWDRANITLNFLRYKHDEDEMQKWVMDEKIDIFDEIYLLQYSDVGIELDQVMKNNGWKLVGEPFYPRLLNDPVVLKFERIKHTPTVIPATTAGIQDTR